MFDAVVFFVGIETGSKKHETGAIINIAVNAVNMSTIQIVDSWDSRIRFLVDRADRSWLESQTSYDEHTWEYAIPPNEAATELSKFLNSASTRRKKSAKGNEYQTWPMCSWDVAKDNMWLSKWYERLGVKFAPFDFYSLSLRHRLPWYFIENPSTDQQDLKTLEDAADYFKIKRPSGVLDAVGKASVAFSVAQEIFGSGG